MIITNGITSKTGDTVLVKFDTAFTNINTLIGYTDTVTLETIDKYFIREIRYSYDNMQWSQWNDLDNEYLSSIIIKPSLYFEIKYTRYGNDIQTQLILSEFNFIINYNSDVIQPTTTLCSSEVISSTDLICDVESVWKPYQMESYNIIQNQLQFAVNAVYGHESTYWRALPNKETSDVIFKEYSLYQNEESKCVRIVIPDNALPDNDISFQMMDMDFYDMPFEIHLLRSEWTRVYGVDSYPRKLDIIYISVLDRLYHIENAYLFNDKGSGQGNYYRLSLVKYQFDANSYMDEDVQQEIDDMTVTMEELFADTKTDEINKITKPDQYKIVTNDNITNLLTMKTDSTTLYDTSDSIINNWTVISDSAYNLADITGEAFTYVTPLSLNDNISMTWWIKPNESDFNVLNGYNIDGFKLDVINSNVIVSLNQETFVFDTNLEIGKWTGCVLTISKTFNQITFNSYTVANTNDYQNTENTEMNLNKQYEKTYNSVGKNITFEPKPLSVYGGNYKLTNFRIFDKIINNKNHGIVLNQNIVVDNEHAMLIDNAIQPLTAIQHTSTN